MRMQIERKLYGILLKKNDHRTSAISISRYDKIVMVVSSRAGHAEFLFIISSETAFRWDKISYTTI